MCVNLLQQQQETNTVHFHISTAEVNSYDGGQMTHKTKNIHYLALYRKIAETSGLNQDF
jgi:hypothetical protein